MTDLKRIKKQNLKLVQDKMENARSHIAEAYEVQQSEIETVISRMFECSGRQKSLSRTMYRIIENLFYKRPSKTVLDFLHTISEYHPDVLVDAVTDFGVYLLTYRERRKPSVKLFMGYLKTSESRYHQRKSKVVDQTTWKQEMGFEDND